MIGCAFTHHSDPRGTRLPKSLTKQHRDVENSISDSNEDSDGRQIVALLNAQTLKLFPATRCVAILWAELCVPI
jgi:hypothetical protein